MKNIKSLQNLIPIENILNNGIIKLKKNNYIKILKISTINYNLKSNLEKEAILNSYKIFLKSCNFNFQILIQSKKENLSKQISKIKENIKMKEKSFLKQYSEQYINFIEKINNEKKSSSKNLFIIIKNSNANIDNKNSEEVIIQELNDKYFKIKEGLSRCGNIVSECRVEETEKILFSFLNSKKFLDKNN